MNNKNSYITPNWYEGKVDERSYRRLFKWGDPYEYKHPTDSLIDLMIKEFNIDPEQFKNPINLGIDRIPDHIDITIEKKHINFFINLLGQENVTNEPFYRIMASYGKSMIDVLKLREKRIENIPDLVLFPSTREEIIEIVNYCNKNKISIYTHSGGSSVTLGLMANKKPGVSIMLGKRFNKIIKLSEVNQTVTVEAGISGPALEKQLNNAKKIFKTKYNYTCGHFPQSFEYSAVGGWVVTRGAGQNSTYYGKIEDLVISQEYITPTGIIKTKEFVRKATGPDIDQIMIGSEGAFGILLTVTLKIFRYMPENRKYFSFIFKTWDDAKNALREIMQSESGYPSVCRLSDPEETDVLLKWYNVEGGFLDKILNIKGYKKGQRCLFIGTADGSYEYTKMVFKNVKKICKKYNALFTTSKVAKTWEKGRFKDPYIREDLQDFGIIIDTLECSVNWENLEYVHSEVRKVVKSRPKTICMSHISHFYPQGGNLYFIFIGKFKNSNEFIEFHKRIVSAINKTNTPISHHHGIGKLFAPWFKDNIGENQFKIIKTLKKHFDPNNIMNPGGTLDLG